MPEYAEVQVASSQTGANAFRCAFAGADQSDIPQLTAWDSENADSALIELLAGTTENGDESGVVAAATNDGGAATAPAWQPGSASAGGALINRLRGNTSYVNLGVTIPAAPFPVHRTFQFSIGIAADMQSGKVGHEPYVAVKMFYTGAPPTVAFEYNDNTEGAPNWVPMTAQPKGTPNPIGIGTTIHATGPNTVAGTGSNNGSLDPLTKPGSGEKFADEIWVRTV